MRISIPIPSHAQLHGGGFEAGFLHPVLGLDHLLAMVAVGILATQMGGKAIWKVPMAFVVMMLVGAFLGFSQLIKIPDELAIAISVTVLGFAIARDKSLPTLLAMISVGFFAFFHGHAHGLEIPKVSSISYYTTGFMMATILLHLAGVVIAYIVKAFVKERALLSHFGSALVGIGLFMLYYRV